MQCFQKDPNLRVTARKLLRHAWIIGSRRSDAPVSKAPSDFNQAVEEVKQWNKALKSSETSLRASTGSDGGGGPGMPPARFHAGDPHHRPSAINAPANLKGPLALAKPRPSAEAFRSPELADDDNWDNDFATSISPSALHLPHLKPQDNFGGLLSSDKLKAFASIDTRNDSSAYDDDFEGELMTIKGPQHFQDFDSLDRTIRPLPRKKSDKFADPTKPPSPSKSSSPRKASHARKPSHAKSPSKSHLGGGGGGNRFELPARPDLAYREQSVEDYSDLFFDSDHVFDQRVDPFAKKVCIPSEDPSSVPRIQISHTDDVEKLDSPQLFHPSDLTSLPRSTEPLVGGSMRRKAQPRPSVLPDRNMRRTRSSIEIQRFAEDEDDEDFSDMFGPGNVLTEKEESDRGSEDGGLMLLSKLSNNSWLGDEEDEDDPFAMMDPGWDEMDLEANIARDRHARLAVKVEDLVRTLKTTEGEDKLSVLSEELVSCHRPMV